MKVPNKLSMLSFVRLVRNYVDDKKGSPIIVHCRCEPKLLSYMSIRPKIIELTAAVRTRYTFQKNRQNGDKYRTQQKKRGYYL